MVEIKSFSEKLTVFFIIKNTDMHQHIGIFSIKFKLTRVLRST